jgi:hypothetical protein
MAMRPVWGWPGTGPSHAAGTGSSPRARFTFTEPERVRYRRIFRTTSSAAGAALFVVLVLRAAAGPIEFEVLGLKFRGASGPVVLWIPCFLAIVVGILTPGGQTYEPLT